MWKRICQAGVSRFLCCNNQALEIVDRPLLRFIKFELTLWAVVSVMAQSYVLECSSFNGSLSIAVLIGGSRSRCYVLNLFHSVLLYLLWAYCCTGTGNDHALRVVL